LAFLLPEFIERAAAAWRDLQTFSVDKIVCNAHMHELSH